MRARENRQDRQDREILSVAQVAELLMISRATVYRLISSKDLPAFTLGAKRSFRILKQDLMNYIEQRKSEVEA